MLTFAPGILNSYQSKSQANLFFQFSSSSSSSLFPFSVLSFLIVGLGDRHSLESVCRRGGSNFFWELLANKSLLKMLAMCVHHRQGACAGQMNQFSVWQTFLMLTGCGTSFDFHKKIDYLFLVGTEEGKIYKVRMVSLSLVLHPLTCACLSGSSS